MHEAQPSFLGSLWARKHGDPPIHHEPDDLKNGLTAPQSLREHKNSENPVMAICPDGNMSNPKIRNQSLFRK